MIKKIRRWLGLPVPYPSEKDLKREIMRLQRVIAEDMTELEALRDKVVDAAQVVDRVYAGLAKHFGEEIEGGWELHLPREFFSTEECVVEVAVIEGEVVVTAKRK